MKRILFMIFAVTFVFALTCGEMRAQATAQISGMARDQSGAVLPGVEIHVTQIETGITRDTITNETGSYILQNLALGPYRFEAALPGFRTFVQTGIVLQVNSNPVINALLEVGQKTEQVEVQANAALVETRSTAVGQVIENERILELPLNGRQVTDLITLSGASVQTGVADRGTFQTGVLISIAGGQSFSVMYSLDGAMHNNVWDGTQMPMPFPDALQEFKVEASGMGAAGGTRGSGGQVNAVTKSGTNEFHGNLFEFVRNYGFNARNFFALQRDTLKRNQYGGTLGGPVVRNKLFFFGGYQGTKTRSDGTPMVAFVPTAAMMGGDFTTFASPACNAGRQITLRAPFVNNRINPALYSRAAERIASALPPAENECGKNTFGFIQKSDELQVVGKVDYQLSPKHSIFGRYVATTLYQPQPYTLSANLLQTNTTAYDNLAQSYALGSTYLIDSNTVNSFRSSANRVAVHRLYAGAFGPNDVGINGYTPVKNNLGVTVTGGFVIGSPLGPGVFSSTVYQIGDDLNLVRRNHQLTFGTNLFQVRSLSRSNNSSVGRYSFNGSATGLGMADFLTGALTTLNQGSPTVWSGRQFYVAAYMADVWKVTPKLTVDYGLRWEPFLPLYLTDGSVYSFSDDRFQKGIKSTMFPNGPAGMYFRGDPGFPKKAAIHKKWQYFAPRMGFAWDPRGDGRTSIRAYYGIAYDFGGSNSLGGTSQSPPFNFIVTLQSPAGGFEDPWRDFPGGIPLPYVFNPSAPRFTPFSTYYPTAKYDMAEPAIQSWNLSVQREVVANFLVSGSYLGRQSTHLWVQGNINRAVYFPGGPCTIAGAVYNPCSATANTDQRRRLFLENPQEGQFISNLAVMEDGGTAQYHGLLLSAQRRPSRGLNISANYTWSHCLGDNATANVQSPGGGGYLDPNNRAFDRGNCVSDRRHIFNMTAVAETPHFVNPTVRALATGWQLSGIYRKSSGQWLTITTGLDRALSGSAANQRPNQILGDPYGDGRSLNSYLNPSAFAQPNLGTIGNMGPFNIVGPGTWQLDLGLSRAFTPREAQKLEFRAETFNVTNSLIKGNPDTNLNSNTFGQINTSSNARIVQFALKYSF